MKLTLVAITGADDNVDPKELVKLSEEYSFVEWGILFSKNRTGQPRYPSREWVAEVVKQKVRLSAHLCGSWVKDIPLFKKEYPNFRRIQLNFAGRSNALDRDRLVRDLREDLGVQFILQYGDTEEELFKYTVEKGCNSVPLFDKSGGEGVLPSEWPNGIWGSFCGYAGGLNPDNVNEELEKIAVASGGWFWIDTESGVRKDDRFDLEKVKTVLEICKTKVHDGNSGS